MEQEKKRVRPTVAQVKALERAISLGNRDLADANRECEELQKKNETLEQSNRLMEEELGRVRKNYQCLSKKYDEVVSENLRLKSRGFWARVFNR